MYKLARAGAVSIGMVYTLIGVIALLSLMKLRDGGAEAASILNMISTIPLGKVWIAFIFLGLLAYILWKFYNALYDPYGYGTGWKGISDRIGIAAAGAAYGLFAWSAVLAFFNISNSTHGQPTDQRSMVADIFEWGSGEWIVGMAGVIIAYTGLAQFAYVIKGGYREKINLPIIAKLTRLIIIALAWIGHFARGIILLIIAYFLVSAALQSNPAEVVNTDKAFNFLGEELGNLSFAIVAAGTICYGFYMFALSYYYNFEDDF